MIYLGSKDFTGNQIFKLESDEAIRYNYFLNDATYSDSYNLLVIRGYQSFNPDFKRQLERLDNLVDKNIIYTNFILVVYTEIETKMFALNTIFEKGFLDEIIPTKNYELYEYKNGNNNKNIRKKQIKEKYFNICNSIFQNLKINNKTNFSNNLKLYNSNEFISYVNLKSQDELLCKKDEYLKRIKELKLKNKEEKNENNGSFNGLLFQEKYQKKYLGIKNFEDNQIFLITKKEQEKEILKYKDFYKNFKISNSLKDLISDGYKLGNSDFKESNKKLRKIRDKYRLCNYVLVIHQDNITKMYGFESKISDKTLKKIIKTSNYKWFEYEVSKIDNNKKHIYKQIYNYARKQDTIYQTSIRINTTESFYTHYNFNKLQVENVLKNKKNIFDSHKENTKKYVEVSNYLNKSQISVFFRNKKSFFDFYIKNSEKYLLIDGENICYPELHNLENNINIVYFNKSKNNYIKFLDLNKKTDGKIVEYEQLIKKGKNHLDMQIIIKSIELLNKNKKSKIIILSHDKGFDYICDCLNIKYNNRIIRNDNLNFNFFKKDIKKQKKYINKNIFNKKINIFDFLMEKL